MAVTAFKLEEAGFTRKQIDALDEHWTQSAATKADIARLEGKIETLAANMRGRFDKLTWMVGTIIGFAALVGGPVISWLLPKLFG